MIGKLPPPPTNSSGQVIIKMIYLAPLYGWMAIGSMCIKRKGLFPPAISAARVVWHIMYHQLHFDPYAHAKLTLWGRIWT